MTDEHGSESEPVHEDMSGQEHTSQPAEAGVWADDHPPVDDFADAGHEHEEAASVSQETAETNEDVAATAVPRSRSMLPLFAGIGGILLIGAVVYWQFGHSSPLPMMTMQSAAVKSPSSSAKSPGSASNKAEETDITSLYKPTPETSPSPSMATAPKTAMAAPPESATAPTAPAIPAAPPAVAPAAPPPSLSSMDTRMDSLAARMDVLQKSVEATVQQISQLNATMAANQASPPTANPNNAVLEDRLNKIEQSLIQLQNSSVAKAPPVSMPAQAEATSEIEAKPVVHHAIPAKHVHKKAKPAVQHRGAPTPPAMPKTSSAWVLRAATPGEAWVATDAKSDELKHVQVGDTLSGIGEIRAIHQTPSGWEIEGADGTVR